MRLSACEYEALQVRTAEMCLPYRGQQWGLSEEKPSVCDFPRHNFPVTMPFDYSLSILHNIAEIILDCGGLYCLHKSTCYTNQQADDLAQTYDPFPTRLREHLSPCFFAAFQQETCAIIIFARWEKTCYQCF